MVFIVIPVFNRKGFTRDCLDALASQTVKGFKVIVVDDGSTDGTAAMLAEDYPDVIVLHGDGNLWWTASINLGIRYALKHGATAVLTLNNDTIPTPTYMEELMRGSAQFPEAMIGSLAVDVKTGKRIYGGETMNPIWWTYKHLLKVLPEAEQHGLHPVSLFPGRGLLIPVSVFDRVGLFAERALPHYLADYDFTFGANLKGVAIYCNFDAVLRIYPDEAGSAEYSRRKSLRNYMNHLFSIKGAGNIRNWTVYTFRNAYWYMIPFHLSKGYAQRFLGYFLK